ncbi:hypothetical protein D9611_006762 [Ephemerocybe angulata]|uniref:non-specific serine/threonine protein kinase n=1 Tax=Ephemerocybe angulata TaxID=980116 RepID=A0A8H5EW20_9AGAR|nr:hypothetical protein D9611_006762 [Tulosesus angulatus]
MAPKPPCAKYQYVVTSSGPKILPVDEPAAKDEESPADYNAGGYLPVKVNDTFKQGRYRIVRKLGWGHFSTVWLVKDTQKKTHSALKVVKSAGRYAETARDEIKLLSQVAAANPNHPGRAHIVSFLDSFSHQGPESSHVCIVFEPLGENLLALIERNKKKGVAKALVKTVAKQILLGLEYLHDECDLVHTDIKPENILISIPDIEAHIHDELSQSPVPTSRRVGVPLPTKSRAGVTIPHNQHRARRQVQIFDSQPLSSPRSAGRSGFGNSSLAMSRADTGSGTNSQSNSYIAPASLLSRGGLKNGSSLPPNTSFVGGSVPSSSVPKIPSNLSSSFRPPQAIASASVPAPPSIIPPADGPRNPVPSTSSSSSSISSTLGSPGPGSSSIISTPPTSLSQSMTGAVAGFMNPSAMPIVLKTRLAIPDGFPAKDAQLLPVQRKSDMKLEAELSAALSSSWKSNASISASWNDKLSSSLSSSYKSKCSPLKSSKPRSSNPYGHNRSQSGAITANWQDPGTAAPAPAVLVSAVVGSDSQGANILSVSNANVVDDSTGAATSTLASEASSATATVRPSPTGTPFGPPSDKLSTDLSDANLSDAKPTGPIPSLLTQTAPAVRNAVTPSSLLHDVPPRASPPQQISQLSAHMHTHQASSLTSCSIAHQHCIHSHTTNPHSGRVPTNSRPTIPIPTTSHKPISPPPPPSSPATEYSASPSLAAFSPVEAVPPPPSNPPITIKIADLGNATPSKKHYTEDIQTRQYRAPEAIVGRKDWDARADVWSVACVIFELLTAEYLFDPQGQGELFTKDDDHMAQIIELMGDFPLEVKMGGKYSRELFDHNGALRYIRTLKPWPLRRVMTEKYLYSDEDASNLCAFLEPMLAVDFRDRVHVRDMVNHPWLDVSSNEEAIEW